MRAGTLKYFRKFWKIREFFRITIGSKGQAIPLRVACSIPNSLRSFSFGNYSFSYPIYQLVIFVPRRLYWYSGHVASRKTVVVQYTETVRRVSNFLENGKLKNSEQIENVEKTGEETNS